MQQKRLILALVISSAILFLWSFFYPVTPPQPNQPVATASPSPTGTPASQSTASPAGQSGQVPEATPVPTTVSSAPQRFITITTPLYEARFDTRGAEPTSWIIKANKNGGQPIYSVAGRKSQKIDLQLISPEGLKRQPRLVPLQLNTNDSALDAALAASTYRVEGVEGESGEANISLGKGEKKSITFVLEDSNRLQVRKTIAFDAELYETIVTVTMKKGDENIPAARLTIGPSIGDQGVGFYTFYSVAPEAVAAVNGTVERHVAVSINGDKKSPDKLVLNGPIDWAGVADTYFAMAAIPSRKTEGLEYRTTAYEHQQPGSAPEKRFLITGYVPIPTDGSPTIVYAGPKDHDLLTSASKEISTSVQRELDLEGLIDYGYLSSLSRPLAVPILKAITFLNKVTGSYGVAIILFTIVIYSLFFPLKWRSSKAMKKAQKLAPKMKELQEKIKGVKPNDPRLKELQMEQLKLMKEGNPLGGCLPLLIQMPFLFALYRAITISLDFRQASFLWIPDLSAAEPYLIHILPILMTGTMVVLQLVTPAPSADPLQRKMMAIGMPLFMLYVLWSAPSGLVLYWLVGNIVGFSQQFLINHFTKTDDDQSPSTPLKSGERKKKNTTSLSRVAEG
jgi:YidC/Oxa1 family membrane protein insertase